MHEGVSTLRCVNGRLSGPRHRRRRRREPSGKINDAVIGFSRAICYNTIRISYNFCFKDGKYEWI